MSLFDKFKKPKKNEVDSTMANAPASISQTDLHQEHTEDVPTEPVFY